MSLLRLLFGSLSGCPLPGSTATGRPARAGGLVSIPASPAVESGGTAATVPAGVDAAVSTPAISLAVGGRLLRSVRPPTDCRPITYGGDESHHGSPDLEEFVPSYVEMFWADHTLLGLDGAAAHLRLVAETDERVDALLGDARKRRASRELLERVS